MQRLPTEIYDRIVYYVARFDDHNPNYEDPHLYPSMYLLHKDARAALSNLRLVDRTFNRSASRALFWGTRARLGQGVVSFPKLEKVSSSEYAKHVRFIHFNIDEVDLYLEDDEDEDEDLEGDEEVGEEVDEDEEVDEEDEEDEDEDDDEELDEGIDGGSARLSNNAVNHLSSLIANFRNLKGFSVWAQEFMPSDETIKFQSQILITVADLQVRGFIYKVTHLRMAIDGATYLATLLNSRHYQTAVRHFLHNLQHLGLVGFNGVVDDYDAPTGVTDLDTLIKSSSNLLSLSMRGCYTLTSLVKYSPGLRLRLESLDLMSLKMSCYDLLALVETCKESIRFISLDMIELVSGSWLHFLVQIKKLPNLITFLFMFNDPFLDEIGGEDSGYQNCFLWHALGDIQRQTNANRVAAGLKPWTSTRYMFLSCAPLKDAIDKEYYEKLCSQNWDVEVSRA